MTAIVLALLCAVGYGTSDFLGGLASRRASYVEVALVVQVVATVSVLVAVPFAGGRLTAGALSWGALGGLGAGTGSVALYRGLARGHMSVAGSISGVGAASLPVVAGLALGDRPSIVTLVGIFLIIPAVWLIARDDGPEGSWRNGGVAEGVLAGVGFGVFFLALSQAGPNVGLWPTAASVVTSACLVIAFYAIAARRRSRARPEMRGAWPAAGGAGVTAGAAVVLYLLATRHGLLVVVAVLAALYPGATVLLARVFLGEQSGRSQVLGLVMAAAAIVAITAG